MYRLSTSLGVPFGKWELMHNQELLMIAISGRVGLEEADQQQHGSFDFTPPRVLGMTSNFAFDLIRAADISPQNITPFEGSSLKWANGDA